MRHLVPYRPSPRAGLRRNWQDSVAKSGSEASARSPTSACVKEEKPKSTELLRRTLAPLPRQTDRALCLLSVRVCASPFPSALAVIYCSSSSLALRANKRLSPDSAAFSPPRDLRQILRGSLPQQPVCAGSPVRQSPVRWRTSLLRKDLFFWHK